MDLAAFGPFGRSIEQFGRPAFRDLRYFAEVYSDEEGSCVAAKLSLECKQELPKSLRRRLPI